MKKSIQDTSDYIGLDMENPPVGNPGTRGEPGILVQDTSEKETKEKPSLWIKERATVIYKKLPKARSSEEVWNKDYYSNVTAILEYLDKQYEQTK